MNPRAVVAGLLLGLLAVAAWAADRRQQGYDPAQWGGSAAATGGTLSRDMSLPSALPGTLSGSVSPSPTLPGSTPPPLPQPVQPEPRSPSPAPAQTLDPWRQLSGNHQARPWGEIPDRFQTGKQSSDQRRREQPIIIVAPPGYMPGQLPGGNALAFPFGYTPGAYATELLTPGLDDGSGYPGGYGWGFPGGWGSGFPGVLGGWPGFLGGSPFSFMPFSWN